MQNENTRNELVLVFKGRDNWNRPVYECNGNLYVDVDPNKNSDPKIFSKYNNELYGEPDTPISVMAKFKGVQIKFEPRRDTWDF